MTTTPAREAIRAEALEEAAAKVEARAKEWRGSVIGGTVGYLAKAEAMAMELVEAAAAIRALKGQSPTKDAPDMVLVPAWLIRFLCGEDHWPDEPGTWFGDTHPTKRGAFFWRRHLLCVPAAAPIPNGREG